MPRERGPENVPRATCPCSTLAHGLLRTSVIGDQKPACVTTFGNKTAGDLVKLEIERAAHAMVDTLGEAAAQRLGALLLALEALARERGLHEPVTES